MIYLQDKTLKENRTISKQKDNKHFKCNNVVLTCPDRNLTEEEHNRAFLVSALTMTRKYGNDVNIGTIVF